MFTVDSTVDVVVASAPAPAPTKHVTPNAKKGNSANSSNQKTLVGFFQRAPSAAPVQTPSLTESESGADEHVDVNRTNDLCQNPQTPTVVASNSDRDVNAKCDVTENNVVDMTAVENDTDTEGRILSAPRPSPLALAPKPKQKAAPKSKAKKEKTSKKPVVGVGAAPECVAAVAAGSVDGIADVAPPAVPAETDVETPAPKVVEKPTKAKRVRKPVAKAAAAEVASEENSDVPAVAEAVAPAVVAPTWAPEATAKLAYCHSRMLAYVRELVAAETALEAAQSDAGLGQLQYGATAAFDDLMTLLLPPAADADASSDAVTNPNTVPNPNAICKVKTLIACSIQGSSLPAPAAAEITLRSLLIQAVDGCRTAGVDLPSGSVAVGAEAENERTAALRYLAYVVGDAATLVNEINTLVQREHYGYKVPLACLAALCPPVSVGETEAAVGAVSVSVSDSAELLVAGRLEAVSLSYFSSKNIAAIQEMKALRNRYGRVIKSVGRSMEQLAKDKGVFNKPALDGLDERTNKCIVDLEKFKEKTREAERKRAEVAAEAFKREQAIEARRREKEDQAELKRREKEEAQAKKAADVVARHAEKTAEKEAQVAAAKKKVAVLNKQQNMLMSFVKAAPKDTGIGDVVVLDGAQASVASETKASEPDVVAAGASPTNTVVKVRRAPANPYCGPMYLVDSKEEEQALRREEARSANPNPNPALLCGRLPTRYFNPTEFESSILGRGDSSAAAGGLLGGQKQRATLKASSLRKKRAPMKITAAVTVVNDASNAFSSASVFSEMRTVLVDPRMKSLSFYEDVRPGYCGTFSKRSRVLSGRAPFRKDEEVFNYEYDSEADWDEEEEGGEDICDSDGGEDSEEEELNGEEGDLVYDDFTRADDDYGSDLEMDGEAELLRANRSKRKQKLEGEVCGPFFISTPASAMVPHYPKPAVAATVTNLTDVDVPLNLGGGGGVTVAVTADVSAAATGISAGAASSMVWVRKFNSAAVVDADAGSVEDNAPDNAADTVRAASVQWSQCPTSSSGAGGVDSAVGLVDADADLRAIGRLMSFSTVFYTPSTAYMPVLGAPPPRRGRAEDGEEDTVSKSEAKRQSERAAMEAALPLLLALVHGSKEGLDKLVQQCVDLCKEKGLELPKAAVQRLIREHAAKKRGKCARRGTAYYTVERVVEHRGTLTVSVSAPTADHAEGDADADSDAPEFLVRWAGYEAEDDTWETLEALSEDAPAKLRAYLEEHGAVDIVTTPNPNPAKQQSAESEAGSDVAPAVKPEPTMLKFGTSRWVVHATSLEQHCPQLLETPVVFTPIKEVVKKTPAGANKRKADGGGAPAKKKAHKKPTPAPAPVAPIVMEHDDAWKGQCLTYPFNRLWKNLMSEGWTWDYGSGLVSQYYILPDVGGKEDRVRGENTFEDEDTVRRVADGMYRQLAPPEDQWTWEVMPEPKKPATAAATCTASAAEASAESAERKRKMDGPSAPTAAASLPVPKKEKKRIAPILMSALASEAPAESPLICTPVTIATGCASVPVPPSDVSSFSTVVRGLATVNPVGSDSGAVGSLEISNPNPAAAKVVPINQYFQSKQFPPDGLKQAKEGLPRSVVTLSAPGSSSSSESTPTPAAAPVVKEKKRIAPMLISAGSTNTMGLQQAPAAVSAPAPVDTDAADALPPAAKQSTTMGTFFSKKPPTSVGVYSDEGAEEQKEGEVYYDGSGENSQMGVVVITIPPKSAPGAAHSD